MLYDVLLTDATCNAGSHAAGSPLIPNIWIGGAQYNNPLIQSLNPYVTTSATNLIVIKSMDSAVSFRDDAVVRLRVGYTSNVYIADKCTCTCTCTLHTSVDDLKVLSKRRKDLS